MKYIKSHIILMLMFVAALTGCEQKILFDDDKNEHIYQLPENGYIFFNSAISNNTRGSLITTPYLQQDFGVIGYQWDYTDANANWETQEQIKPNLFANTHQQVTYANNIHSYTPIKEWETGKRYAFFAYYPHSIAVSGADVEHTPYLTYTLPTTPTQMLDIMTASAIDMDYSSSQGGIVNLAFKHRLSAIDVQMLNLNDPYLTGEDRLPVYIKVTNMNITFYNLRYNTAKLYIDNTIPGHSDEFTTNGTVKQDYTLFTELTEHIPPVETGANVTYVTSGNPLIVIPQTAEDESFTGDTKYKEFLNGTLSFNYQYLIKNTDGTYSNKTSELKTNDESGYHQDGDYISRNIEFNISRDLLPGRRYTLLLTFTRNATTIDILKDGDWDDRRSEITFE
ncbi:MAG: hypothetical protein J6Q08_04155 [Bacteroidaceae bacterium]|nr:hypothetical protein [Bacteroidaceae bacterium]